MCIDCNDVRRRRSPIRIPQSEFVFDSPKKSPPGKKTLASEYPEIAHEWDYDKNGSLQPEDVPPKSHRRVWWKCIYGHSYDTMVFSRTCYNSGCPYCAGQKPIKGETDLATCIPQILAEWDDSKNALGPDEYTAFSSAKVWWKCPDCHTSYLARIVNRTANGTRCPYCWGSKSLAGSNSLQDLFPAIAAEWDRSRNELPLDQVTAGSEKKVWWRCPLGHSYDMIIKNRTIKGEGCPYCSGHRVLVGFNDLVTTHPHIAAEWDTDRNGQKNPYQYTHGSDEIVWWRCPFGNHSYQTTISSRTCHGQGCPCSCGRKVFAGHNDLQSLYPNIAAEFDNERNEKSSDQYTAYSNEEVWWCCPLGHSYQARIDNHTLKDDGCPFCANKQVLTGFNDLLTAFPSIIYLWDNSANDEDPSSILATINTQGWLLCSSGHSYLATINGYTREYTSCPYCNNRELLTGFNDLLTVFPDIQDKWHYDANQIAPDLFLALSKVKAFVCCSARHSYLATVEPYKHKISTCPYCSGLLPIVGETDLTTTNPELCERWDYEGNPRGPELCFPSSSSRVSWRCENGHTFQAPIRNMAIKFRCRECEKNVKRKKRK